MRQWLQSISEESFEPTTTHRICSKHFAPSCFYRQHNKRWLKPDAVPTILEWKDTEIAVTAETELFITSRFQDYSRITRM